jgi:5-(carboxyamino)imidazole ribonucleotide mutase
MPPGIPVATVGLDAAYNAGILAGQMLATADDDLHARMVEFKMNMKQKIVKANQDLASEKFDFRVQ